MCCWSAGASLTAQAMSAMSLSAAIPVHQGFAGHCQKPSPARKYSMSWSSRPVLQIIVINTGDVGKPAVLLRRGRLMSQALHCRSSGERRCLYPNPANISVWRMRTQLPVVNEGHARPCRRGTTEIRGHGDNAVYQARAVTWATGTGLLNDHLRELPHS